MDLLQQIVARAKADKQRIVLPEAEEERTLKAADKVLADDLADIILIGHSETPGSKDVCSSPGIIAACRVLHRLPVPRHPPCARGILRDRSGPAGYPRVAKIN